MFRNSISAGDWVCFEKDKTYLVISKALTLFSKNLAFVFFFGYTSSMKIVKFMYLQGWVKGFVVFWYMLLCNIYITWLKQFKSWKVVC